MLQPNAEQFRARLLVAEDNPINLDIATRILENLGCEVVAADNGAVAALLLAQQQFDLVLMDCEMPEVDGLEATKLARIVETLQQVTGTENRKRVPIVALTSHAPDDIREKCLAAGMDDLLSKPFTKAQMRETLRRWVGDGNAAPADPAPAAAAAAGFEASAAIDRSVLDALVDANGAQGASFLGRLLGRFAQIAPTQLAAMEEKFAAGNADELWRVAHNLKSSASALGARQVSRRAAEIEKHARHAGLTGLRPMLDQLGIELGQALESLKSLAGEMDERARRD